MVFYHIPHEHPPLLCLATSAAAAVAWSIWWWLQMMMYCICNGEVCICAFNFFLKMFSFLIAKNQIVLVWICPDLSKFLLNFLCFLHVFRISFRSYLFPQCALCMYCAILINPSWVALKQAPIRNNSSTLSVCFS